MKKFVILLICIVYVFGIKSQVVVPFSFEPDVIITDEGSKSKMQRQIELLLSRLYSSAKGSSNTINFSGIDISETAKLNICMNWEHVHFCPEVEGYVLPCLEMGRRNAIHYQVRGFYMKMNPVDNTYTDKDYQEMIIYLDRNGKIINFTKAIEKNQYEEILKNGKDIEEIDRRLQIAEQCEAFRMAYNSQDISFMEDIFSDDALIIVGSVRERVTAAFADGKKIRSSKKVKKSVRTKKEYLDGLRSIFNDTRDGGYVRVQFDDLEFQQDGGNPNFYSVTMKQTWDSKRKSGARYHDEGIVVLIWDFTNEKKPKIQVRTWQDISTPKKDINSLPDFDIPTAEKLKLKTR